MQTRREWLVSKGLATPGRGRMSKAAHDAVNEALANGMQFADVPTQKAAVTKNSDSKPIRSEEVTRKNSVENAAGPTMDPIWTAGWYVEEKGKRIKVSGNNACGECGYSLDYQTCKKPTTLNSSAEMVRVHSTSGLV